MTNSDFEIKAELAAKMRYELRTAHLLEIASEFELWRQSSGADTTHTIFIEEFGYPNTRAGAQFTDRYGHVNSMVIYEAVMELIALAKKNS